MKAIKWGLISLVLITLGMLEVSVTQNILTSPTRPHAVFTHIVTYISIETRDGTACGRVRDSCRPILRAVPFPSVADAQRFVDAQLNSLSVEDLEVYEIKRLKLDSYGRIKAKGE